MWGMRNSATANNWIWGNRQKCNGVEGHGFMVYYNVLFGMGWGGKYKINKQLICEPGIIKLPQYFVVALYVVLPYNLTTHFAVNVAVSCL